VITTISPGPRTGGRCVAGQTFAARLRELREGAGLTQAALAERAGVHSLTVAKLEQALREPTWATVEALARALGVSCTAFEGTSAPPGEAPEEPPPKRRPGRPRGRPAGGKGGTPKGKGKRRKQP
jgi:DNA-binding XRE family transcriptional regulator